MNCVINLAMLYMCASMGGDKIMYTVLFLDVEKRKGWRK